MRYTGVEGHLTLQLYRYLLKLISFDTEIPLSIDTTNSAVKFIFLDFPAEYGQYKLSGKNSIEARYPLYYLQKKFSIMDYGTYY